VSTAPKSVSLSRPLGRRPLQLGAFEVSAAATDAWTKAELGRVLRQLGGKLRRSFPSMPPPNRHPDYDNEQLATRNPMSTPRPPFDFSQLRARQAREQASAVARAERLAALVRERVPPILRRYGAGRAWLFGSIAAGRCHARSDVDLLVLGIAAADYWALRHDLEQTLDRPVDLLTQDDDPIMVRKVTERGVLIHEPHA
jgi:uncharacterized protein